MRFSEFKSSQLRGFKVLVKLRKGGTIKTVVFAEAQAWAMALARQMYGEQNIVSVVEDIDEQKKPPTAEQQRIKSLNDHAKRYRDLARQAKAQERLKSARTALDKTKPYSALTKNT
jgi:hypothetical protein